MKLYFAPNSRAVRVAWLLEELELEYEIEKYKLGDAAMRAPDYLAIHPMGRVPVLEDGDIRIFESGAIVQYLLAVYGHGQLQPGTMTAAYADYLQWLHYCEGMIMPPINTIV
ncbi:glutathione S-transferase family protein, partial [Cribrihabitans sp. XS_ASV171]